MVTKHRRALHRIPELDHELPETAAYLCSVLEPLPCVLERPVGDAVCAYFDFGAEKTVALRSDMDALPVTELTGADYASCHPGKMHACGHDGHMAMLLALAQELPALQPGVNVLLIFQPAEETTGGAREICETGILEKYHVSAVFGMHLWPDLPKHTVASRPGGMMARSCELTVELTGRSIHLARWREGVDALAGAVRFIEQAYALAETAPCLLRFGRMESGSARNSVSDRTRLEGSLRCFDDETFARLWAGLEAIDCGCPVQLSRSQGYPPVTNDADLLAKVRAALPVAEVEPTFITEDFSEYQRRVPGVFFLLGTGGIALHAPQFDFDETVLETGLSFWRRLLTETAL